MKGNSIQIISMFFVFILGAAVTQAGATVIIVDDSGGGNYSSIQKAVDNAQNGDTILVSPGVYQENIKVDKELTIISHSILSGDQANCIRVIGAIPNNDVFYINSNNVTIDGFYILGCQSGTDRPEAGIYLEGVQGCSLSNNILILNGPGIVLNNSQGNHLDSNFISLGEEGIALDSSEENVLSNNMVVTNRQGILLDNSVNNILVNNTADSNTIGVFLGMSHGNKLAYNHILKNEYGIFGQAAEHNTLIDNGMYLNGVGVYLNESSDNAIYRNEFINLFNAVDRGNNTWNSSSEGNFWNDHTGRDVDGNGVADTPYPINQTAGSMDYMPQVNETLSSNNSENAAEKMSALIALLNKGYSMSSGNAREKGTVIETTRLEQINSSLQEGPVFLRIGAEWCPLCKAMNPTIQDLAEEYGGKAAIMLVDADRSPEFRTYFGVLHIPDFSVIVDIENGEYVYMKADGNVSKDIDQARLVGIMDKGVLEKVLDLSLLRERQEKSG
ncbi:NosD domain-containing protein [Methanosarcina sp. T3]|uniref:NosD domain-containing protein n=1 Tax=Methanosarcina sp. T3 TaxID=3439062 RepID=UPI003F86D8DF